MPNISEKEIKAVLDTFEPLFERTLKNEGPIALLTTIALAQRGVESLLNALTVLRRAGLSLEEIQTLCDVSVTSLDSNIGKEKVGEIIDKIRGEKK